MAGETEDGIPETGAVFTFGKSKFADNVPSKFWLKNDVPLKLACGDEHSALITENGKLFMFGSNNWGQLGLGEKISVNKPTCVKALKSEKVKLVACGRTHTLVYTSTNNLYAAGGNNEGQLGLGDYVERTSFQLVEFFIKGSPVKMLAAGSNTSAAITQDGKLYVWGDNSEGQIGLGEEEGTSIPRELDIGKRVTWISCGYYHSAFVTEDGELFCFGERDSGKLGLGLSQLPDHRVPQQVQGICEPVLQVACGGGHTLALTEKHLYSFGLGQFGQLGHGTFIFESLIPKEVEHFRKGRVKHIACGENHSAVVTESELLYTFGDGRHGKLALGDEYFANQFKPTLCPRFLKHNVQAVTCGGCHMVVLAKPRHRSEVILEDNDVTEDHLEKLLRESDPRHSLNRSLSARDRRRERERSPEQFGIMFRTLPPLNSGHLNVSLPASSQTLPSQLNQRISNNFPRNGFLSNTGKEHFPKDANLTEEHQQVDGKTPFKNYRDNESMKDLGETAELFNLTHVMKMDPSEKTVTLCPVQKKRKVKAGGKCSKVVEHLTKDPGIDHRWAGIMSSTALPTGLLKTHIGKSQFGERQLPRIPQQSSESIGVDSDKGSAAKKSRIGRNTVRKHKAESDSQNKLIEIKSKAKMNLSQEDVPYEVDAHLSILNCFETEKEAYKLEEKDKGHGQAGKNLKARLKTWSVEKRQEQGAEEKFLARITQVKHIPAKSNIKVEKVESKAVAEQDVKTWDRSASDEQYNRVQVASRKTQSTHPVYNMKKTKGLEATDSISSPSENTLPDSLVEMTSLIKDLPNESPVLLLKTSRSTSFNSSQTCASRNSLDEQKLLNTASIYDHLDKNLVSKKLAVTINVKPVPPASDEETESIQEKTEDKEDKSVKEVIGQVSLAGGQGIPDTEKLARNKKRAVKSGTEENRSVETDLEKGEKSDPESEEELEDEEVSDTVEQNKKKCIMDKEKRDKSLGEPEEEDSEEETESIPNEEYNSKMGDTAERENDGSQERTGSAETEQNKSKDEEESGNKRQKKEQEKCKEGKEKKEESKTRKEEEEESESGAVEGEEEEESENEGNVENGEEGKERKEEEEEGEEVEELEAEGEKSELEEEESEGEKEDSGTEKEENVGDVEDSGTDIEESEEDEEESGTYKEGSEEESRTDKVESEEDEEESRTDKEESEEDEESGMDEEESEGDKEKSGTDEEESEGDEKESGTDPEESEGDEEESAGDEEESGTDKEESEEDEEESGTDKEESEEYEEESGTDKEESEEDEEESGTDKEESEEDEEESGTDKEESEEDEEESGTDKEESEEYEGESGTDNEESKEDEEESGTDKEESEENEEESGTDKEECEEDEEESGTDKDECEEESGTDKDESEEESGTDEEESEEDEEESGTDKEESEEDEEKSGTDKEESKGDVEESETDKQESEEEGNSNKTEKEESDGEKEASEREEEESRTEKGESEGEAEKRVAGQNKSRGEEEDQETDIEEKDSGGEEEEGEAAAATETEQENDSDIEKEVEKSGKDKDEKKETGKDGMASKQKSSYSQKTLARRHQSSLQSHEPRQFWDDVLPQYLNLK